MAVGAGAGVLGLVKAVAMLVGVVSVWRSNRAKRKGEPEAPDPAVEERRAATREAERRMSAYLASRNSQRSSHNEDI